MSKFKKTLDTVKEVPGSFSKALHTLGAPQRKVMNYAAEQLGVTGNPEDSEESSRAIVQNLSDRMGLPEDSSLVNAGKALGVAGLEVFGDPLNAIPVGKIGKMGMKAGDNILKAVADPVMVERLKTLFKQDPQRFEKAAQGNDQLMATVNKLKDQPMGAVDAAMATGNSVKMLRPDTGFGAIGTRDNFDKIRKALGKK